MPGRRVWWPPPRRFESGVTPVHGQPLADLDFGEARGLKKALELGLRESKPTIEIEFPGLLQAMPEQVEDDDTPARPENATSGFDGLVWFQVRDATPG